MDVKQKILCIHDAYNMWKIAMRKFAKLNSFLNLSKFIGYNSDTAKFDKFGASFGCQYFSSCY